MPAQPDFPSPIKFWPLQWALPVGVHAVCTTRVGGVSKPPFDGLNLGDHVHDDPTAVMTNRALLHTHLGGSRPVFLKQVHGVEVVALSAITPDGTQADACFTQDPHVACTIMVADCLPVLFTDVTGSVVAAAHVGWRGLAAGVVEHTVRAVCAKAQVQAAHIHAWLGPCIGPDRFEVGQEVQRALVQASRTQMPMAQTYFKPHPVRPHKWFADLAGLTRERLLALGLTSLAGNDSSDAWCTVIQSAKLFSYRRERVTGRFAACIWRS